MCIYIYAVILILKILLTSTFDFSCHLYSINTIGDQLND